MATALSDLAAENERLTAEVERLQRRLETLQAEELRAAVDQSLHDLECAELKCWCFTRAAMRSTPLRRVGPCPCANCSVWRALSAALDAIEARR